MANSYFITSITIYKYKEGLFSKYNKKFIYYSNIIVNKGNKTFNYFYIINIPRISFIYSYI